MKLTNLEDFGRAMDAVLYNGVALVEEAELLFSNGRFARAYALAHLACEEFTKIWSLFAAAMKTFNGETVDWRILADSFRSHRAKIWRHVILTTLTTCVPTINNEIDFVAVLKSMLKEVRSLSPSKNASIYVDIGEDVIHTPADAISHEMAAKAIRTARTSSGYHAALQLDFLNKLDPKSVDNLEKLQRTRARLTDILMASGLMGSGVTEASTP